MRKAKTYNIYTVYEIVKKQKRYLSRKKVHDNEYWKVYNDYHKNLRKLDEMANKFKDFVSVEYWRFDRNLL
jgi:hypothetical protein